MMVPAVREWLASNPVEFGVALSAVNVLLRFITYGKYEITDDTDTSTSGTTKGGTAALMIGGLALGSQTLTGCGHDVTVDPDGGVIVKDDATLTWDKTTGTITYTQDAPAPEPDGPVVIVQQPGK